MSDERPELRLCYVSGGAAYFTTQPIERQWGDDWNDAPYEHNAGRPYEPHLHEVYGRLPSGEWGMLPPQTDDHGRPLWIVRHVYWEGRFLTPHDGHWNSPYSVQAINDGAIPWLRPYPKGSCFLDEEERSWRTDRGNVESGVTLREFVNLILANEGMVYLPLDLEHALWRRHEVGDAAE